MMYVQHVFCRNVVCKICFNGVFILGTLNFRDIIYFSYNKNKSLLVYARSHAS